MLRTGASAAGRGKRTSQGKRTELDQLTDDIICCKDEYLSQFRSDEELFSQCVTEALKNEKLTAAPTKRSNCSSKVFKFLWIFILFLLGFCLVAVGFKPVTFLIHKAVHDRLYYILRPVRLAMVSILPIMDRFGMDFLNADCMLENPILAPLDGCPCFRIKYATEMTLNSSSLPLNLTQNDLVDVYVLRNVSQFEHDFSIDKLTNFPSMNGGAYPSVCSEMAGENEGMYRYDEFYQEKTMTKLLSDKNAWSFSWQECPDDNNPLTLHSIIPSLPPVTNSNSLFTVSSKWGMFSHFDDHFPTGAIVVSRVLVGEARFMMLPEKDECVGTCSGFRTHPILRQGDALLFDQRVWNYIATSWTDVTFISVQLVSVV